MRGGLFKRDDVDALPDTEDIALVPGVPEGGCVTQVRAGGHEQLEGYILGAGGVVEGPVGIGVGFDCRAEFAGGVFEVAEVCKVVVESVGDAVVDGADLAGVERVGGGGVDVQVLRAGAGGDAAEEVPTGGWMVSSGD